MAVGSAVHAASSAMAISLTADVVTITMGHPPRGASRPPWPYAPSMALATAVGATGAPLWIDVRRPIRHEPQAAMRRGIERRAL